MVQSLYNAENLQGLYNVIYTRSGNKTLARRETIDRWYWSISL